MEKVLKSVLRICIYVSILAIFIASAAASDQFYDPSKDFTSISTDVYKTSANESECWDVQSSACVGVSDELQREREIMSRYSLLSLNFIPNAGQVDDPEVKFIVKAPGTSLFFTPAAVYLIAISGEDMNQVAQVIRQTFPGSNDAPDIRSTNPSKGKAHFLFGSEPERWQQDLPTYEKIVYHDLYPGIDLSYFGSEGHLKREFIVAPGMDPTVIRFAYEGVENIYIDESGALRIITNTGELVESPLVCYQIINNDKVPVGGQYIQRDQYTIAIKVGDYDPLYSLIIDPELVYSTYYGGTSEDYVNGIAVDSSGNAYITGYTYSSNFLTTPGVVNSTKIGGVDAFVVKLNPSGSAPVYST